MNIREALFISMFFLPFLLCAAPEANVDPLRDKAVKGDMDSCFYLGNEYFYGDNRQKNLTLAAYWYRKAAEGGIPEAQYNYASCLEAGWGVDRSLQSAFDWYEKASKQNFHPASFRIAKFYLTGIKDENGKEQLRPSAADALEMLEKLAAQEYEPAELDLCMLLMRRNTKPEEKARAFRILTRVTSRKKFDPSAYRMLADCYYGGYGCEPDHGKMISLLKEGAAKGDPEAMGKLGFLYEYGRVVSRDVDKAQKLYREAAQAGHPMAQFKYAEAITEGYYKDMTVQDAMTWYRKSAEGNCPQAIFKLGVIYYEGLGVEKDLPRAAHFFFVSAKLGYARAQYNLACMFAEGQGGLVKDKEASFYWFLQAAENGDVTSQKRVAECYMEGIGVDRSITQSEKWYRRAANAGDMSARNRLMEIQRASPW